MTPDGRRRCARPGCPGRPSYTRLCNACWTALPEDLRERWAWAFVYGEDDDREAVIAEVRHWLED